MLGRKGNGRGRGIGIKAAAFYYVPALSKCTEGRKRGKNGVRRKERVGEDKNSFVKCSAVI